MNPDEKPCDCPVAFPDDPEMRMQVHRYDCPNMNPRLAKPYIVACYQCGKKIDVKQAMAAYEAYFCSEECKQKFPERLERKK